MTRRGNEAELRKFPQSDPRNEHDFALSESSRKKTQIGNGAHRRIRKKRLAMTWTMSLKLPSQILDRAQVIAITDDLALPVNPAPPKKYSDVQEN